MYCLQFLLPVLLIPKPIIHPTFLIDHALFLWFYIIGFIISKRLVSFLFPSLEARCRCCSLSERQLLFRPCHVCLILFFVAAFFLCYSDSDNCSLWPFCEMNASGLSCRRQHEEGVDFRM